MNAQRTTCIAAALATLVAAVGSAAAAAPTAERQHVAIEITFDAASMTGSYKVLSLRGNAIETDAGKLVASGSVKPSVLKRNGQRVTVVRGRMEHTGKLGTFAISQRVESADVGGIYSSDRGTWTFRGKTGQYAGLRGGGAFAGIGLPNGTVLARQEGYLAKR